MSNTNTPIKLEFADLGDGQYVEIKDPKRLKWGEQKSIVSAFKDESVSAQLDVAERIAIALVKNGYLLDDENRPIAFPLTAETVGNVPAVVIEVVSKAFADAKKEASGKN